MACAKFMDADNDLKWRKVKARLIVHFGSVTKAAQAIGCNDESIRGAVRGTCPGVAERLADAINDYPLVFGPGSRRKRKEIAS